MQKEVQKIVEALASKYKLPPYVIEEIINSQFKFTRDIIKKGDNEVVMLHGLCKFAPSLKKIEWINKHKAKKNEDSGDAL